MKFTANIKPRPMKFKFKRINFFAFGVIFITLILLIFYYFYVYDSLSPALIPTAKSNSINLLNGQWGYLPGSNVEKDGLHIAYRDFKIVEQDGSGGQPNPPVNEYGTRLNAKSFYISTELSDIKGTASAQFYGTPPIVSDEFRVETPSVRLSVDGRQLTVAIWNGKSTQNLSDQRPITQKSYSLGSASSSEHLGIADQNGVLTIYEGSKTLGALSDNEIFSSNQVWFGFNVDSQNGSFVVSSLNASPLKDGYVKAVDTSATTAYTKDPNGLQQLVNNKRPGFLIGTDAALWATSDPAYSQTVFGGNFGIITPENAMKWQFTEPQPGVYDFQEADALVALAQKNHMQVWGHNLVFSEALPRWVQDLPTNTPAQKAYVKWVMINHIQTLVEHFKGKVMGWDVVNEPISDYDANGNFTTTYRDNVFYRAMGVNYIAIALEAAHQADPNVQLGINDWGFDGLGNDSSDPRANAVYSLLKSLKQQGVPLDYFGFEAHDYDPSTDMIVDNNGNAPVLKQHIEELAALGINSRISEMDAPLEDPTYNGSSQADQFVGVLNTCLSEPTCTTVSFWSLGITDMSQGDDNYPYDLQTGEVDSPFNQQMQPNPSYFALQNALK